MDLVYTRILTHAPANDKITLIKRSSGRKFNYVFVGSSRVNNCIIPSIIEKETGKTSLNLGVESARPHDILTLVKLLVASNVKCDSVFVQADYGFNHLESSTFLEFQAMPYLRQDSILSNHMSYLPDAWALKHIPFYRYAVYERKIGLHSTFAALRRKSPSNLEKTSGCMLLRGQQLLDEYTMPKTISVQNRYCEELEKFAKIHNLHLVYFTSPFMLSVKTKDFMSKLKKKIPGLHDYSRAIASDSLFRNQSHLNNKGAAVFTELLLSDLLTKR